MSNFKWLAHGGPGSGRYPKGSGDRPYQHGFSFKTKKKKRKISGVSDIEGSFKISNVEKKDDSKKGPTAKDIENLGKKVSDVQNATRTVSNNVETIYKHIRNTKHGKKNRASGLTDDELRSAINRIQLEKRPHRFDKLYQQNPKEWKFWMIDMGWGKVLDYIGVEWTPETLTQQMEFDFSVKEA